MSNSPVSQKYIALLQWAIYLLLLSYWVIVGGVYYYMIKFPVAVLNLVLIGTAGVIWLGVRLIQKARLPRTGLEGALLWLGITQVIVTATSVDWRLSLETLAQLTAFILAGLALADLIAHGWPEAQLINGLFFAAGIMCFAGAWEVGSWYSRWWQLGIWIPPVAYRLQGLLSHPNLTAGFLNLIIPLAVVKLLRATTRLERISLSLLLAVMAVLLFFTSSRGGWIATVVALGVTLALYYGRAFIPQVSQWLPKQARQLNFVQWAFVGITSLIGIMGAGWLLFLQTISASHGPLFSSRQNFWVPAFQLFSQHWLTGIGPGLFSRMWATVDSLPPNPVVVHAHNTYLLVATESGLLGFSSVLLLGLAYGLIFQRRWKAVPEQRWLMAAVAGGLSSVLTQGLFDFLLNSPAFVFILILVAALGLSRLPMEGSIPGLPAGALILPTVGAFIIFIYSLWGYAPFAQGLNQTALDEEAALTAICIAPQRDSRFALYWQQCGLAYSQASLKDKAFVPLALQAFEQAIALDPTWPANYANKAALEWQAGETDQALQAMQVAAKLAPKSALFALNLGWFYEAQGDAEQARTAYQKALDLRNSAQALFWKQTPLRAGVLAHWQANHPNGDDLLTQAQAAFDTQHYAKALEFYQSAVKAYSIYPSAYIGLARTSWKLGQDTQGNQFAEEALLIPIFTSNQQVELYWLQAEAAEREGDRTRAIRYGSQYFIQISNPGIMGPGSWGYPAYAWFGYRREGLPVEFVPQLIQDNITPETDTRLTQLAHWYEADQQHATACLILERIYHEAPISEGRQLREKICP
jgi:putative inorganic carbon (hco3(-)) transporter